MAIVYVWQFSSLNVKLKENDLSDVVYSVNWHLSGTEGAYSANVYGSCGVQPPQPDAFTPYDQLTEAQVQGWVETALGADKVAAYKDNITKQIELQKNPVDASLQPPWS